MHARLHAAVCDYVQFNAISCPVGCRGIARGQPNGLGEAQGCTLKKRATIWQLVHRNPPLARDQGLSSHHKFAICFAGGSTHS